MTDVRTCFRGVACYGIAFLLVSQVSAQFPNMFSGMMGNTGSTQTGNGSACATNTALCLPWCTRGTDSNGCSSCVCHSGTAGNPMSGMHQMSGMNPMVGGNQMASMFSGLSGGQSPMTGGGVGGPMTGGGVGGPMTGGGVGGPRVGSGTCGPIPRTCPFPQPWCQRVTDNNGCAKCLCGADLTEFMQKFTDQTKTTDSPTTPAKTTNTTTAPSSKTSAVTRNKSIATSTSSSTPPTTSSGASCLSSFHCIKICNYGYKSDINHCPLCECEDWDLVDTPVDATDPPGKYLPTTTNPNSHPTVTDHVTPKPIVTDHVTSKPIVTDQLTSCPGIFDCSLMCNNGYKSDTQGCPVCDCVQD